jgi:putative aminopeptidase FrvX
LGDEARLVFITHMASGGAVTKTIEDLGRLEVVDRVGGVLRVVGPEDQG